MRQQLLIVIILIISCSGYSQGQIDATDIIGLEYSVKKSGYISVKKGTPVYKSKSLSGVIVYEFKRDTVVHPIVISNSYFEIDSLGYISPYSYIPNTFYSTVLDSIVSNKLQIINSLSNLGISDNTLVKLHKPINFTVDTTYTNYSSQTLRYCGSELLVKKSVGNYYLAYNSKIIEQDIYLNKEHLEGQISESLENSTKNLLPSQIRKLNEGKALSKSQSNWKMISSFNSGDYSSKTYRAGNTYRTVTSYNGQVSTSDYVQY